MFRANTHNTKTVCSECVMQIKIQVTLKTETLENHKFLNLLLKFVKKYANFYEFIKFSFLIYE